MKADVLLLALLCACDAGYPTGYGELCNERHACPVGTTCMSVAIGSDTDGVSDTETEDVCAIGCTTVDECPEAPKCRGASVVQCVNGACSLLTCYH